MALSLPAPATELFWAEAEGPQCFWWLRVPGFCLKAYKASGFLRFGYFGLEVEVAFGGSSRFSAILHSQKYRVWNDRFRVTGFSDLGWIRVPES